jgi:KDO2-lipid IV(A) lauroyltransferase
MLWKTRVNIALAYPELNPEQKEQLARLKRASDKR